MIRDGKRSLSDNSTGLKRKTEDPKLKKVQGRLIPAGHHQHGREYDFAKPGK